MHIFHQIKFVVKGSGLVNYFQNTELLKSFVKLVTYDQCFCFFF